MTDTIVIKENPKQLIKENTVEIVKKDKRDEKLINYMIDQMMQADAKKKFEKLTSLLEINRDQYLATVYFENFYRNRKNHGL